MNARKTAERFQWIILAALGFIAMVALEILSRTIVPQ